MTTHRTKAISVAMSHDRPRTELGPTPPVPPPPAEATAPWQDPKTGRIIDGRAAQRRRRAKEKHNGFASLDPNRCESWLAPSVRLATTHGVELAARFPDPALAALVGATSDAYGVYRALISLGAKGDAKALAESRAWLREYRACLRELSALAALAKTARDEAALDAPLWVPPANDDEENDE